jgi:hypothetical protein
MTHDLEQLKKVAEADDVTEEMLRAYNAALRKYIQSLPPEQRVFSKTRRGGLPVSWRVKAEIRFKAMLEASPLLSELSQLRADNARMKEAWARYADLRGSPHQHEYVDGGRTFDLVIVAWGEMQSVALAKPTTQEEEK